MLSHLHLLTPISQHLPKLRKALEADYGGSNGEVKKAAPKTRKRKNEAGDDAEDDCEAPVSGKKAKTTTPNAKGGKKGQRKIKSEETVESDVEAANEDEAETPAIETPTVQTKARKTPARKGKTAKNMKEESDGADDFESSAVETTTAQTKKKPPAKKAKGNKKAAQGIDEDAADFTEDGLDAKHPGAPKAHNNSNNSDAQAGDDGNVPETPGKHVNTTSEITDNARTEEELIQDKVKEGEEAAEMEDPLTPGDRGTPEYIAPGFVEKDVKAYHGEADGNDSGTEEGQVAE